MKKIYLAFVLTFTFIQVNAQWVTIPDTSLATKLQQIYPTCFNGMLMDTTCTPIIQATTLFLNNEDISNLTGIEYFDNLKVLRCGFNQITNISTLPPLLDTLECYNNSITNISGLPTSLKFLNCRSNLITNLNIPNGLLHLDIYGNQFSTLPILPSTLEELTCSANLLTSLPTLPINLVHLDCSWNSIDTLPAIPASLLSLSANGNNLSSLPPLPPTLEWLFLDDNQFTSLPPLPPSLVDFWCAFNNLTTLPLLPTNLMFLDCSFNQITALPTIPSGLIDIWANNNSLTYIPELPDSMFRLLISDNPSLQCLPELKKMDTFEFFNTDVQCLPNYGEIINSNPPLSNFPICDIINTNGCDVYWNISGKVYGDLNSNCIDDSTEYGLKNLKLLLYNNSSLVQQSYSLNEGTYAFKTSLGTYDYTVDTSGFPFILTCPPSLFHTSVLTPGDSIDSNINFAMECKSGYDVGAKYIIRESGRFFPGDSATIKIGAGDIANFYAINYSYLYKKNVLDENFKYASLSYDAEFKNRYEVIKSRYETVDHQVNGLFRNTNRNVYLEQADQIINALLKPVDYANPDITKQAPYSQLVVLSNYDNIIRKIASDASTSISNASYQRYRELKEFYELSLYSKLNQNIPSNNSDKVHFYEMIISGYPVCSECISKSNSSIQSIRHQNLQVLIEGYNNLSKSQFNEFNECRKLIERELPQLKNIMDTTLDNFEKELAEKNLIDLENGLKSWKDNIGKESLNANAEQIGLWSAAILEGRKKIKIAFTDLKSKAVVSEGVTCILE